jgi:aspartyl-tRNA synthetase
MAFPKTQSGHDLMAETPSQVTPEQLVEVGIGLAKPAKAAEHS